VKNTFLFNAFVFCQVRSPFLLPMRTTHSLTTPSRGAPAGVQRDQRP
jgi:hypothetical protein